jgi:hypothetical protein
MGMSPPACIPNAIIAKTNRTTTRFLLHSTNGMTTKQAADPKAAADIKQFIFEFNFSALKNHLSIRTILYFYHNFNDLNKLSN